MSDHICARCARHQKTCCQTREIYATPGDVERIRAHTGRTEFYAFRVPENPDYLDQDDDPAWRDNVFRADNSRRTLDRQPNGDCTFLGPVGCTLPTEVRPIICRIYPYDYDERGIAADLAEGCPTQLLHAGEGLLQALDMHLADAERWRRQLYAEIRLEQESTEGPPMRTPAVVAAE
jgi:uncharacterized protein